MDAPSYITPSADDLIAYASHHAEAAVNALSESANGKMNWGEEPAAPSLDEQRAALVRAELDFQKALALVRQAINSVRNELTSPEAA